MDLYTALTTEDTTTANGMTASSTTGSWCVDLFFAIGASRTSDITVLFSRALGENAEVARRILLWARDVRGGAGERSTFRKLANHLAHTAPDYAEAILNKTALVGRWDDVFAFFGTILQGKACEAIKEALASGNGLCAKWMPRHGKEKKVLMSYLGLNPKTYRKYVVGLSKTVEQQMSAQKWDSIEYGKLPSIASARYQGAFGKHSQERYAAYLESLKKGEEKINASAIFPYQIVTSLGYGNADIASEQWKALPNYLKEGEMILPVCDVSGSMMTPVGSGSTTALDVSVSLGLYISERNIGPFKDMFITFSGKPSIQKLTGTLKERFDQLCEADWAMNTDLEKTFSVILSHAVKHRVPVSQMPTKVLILSDMQFDQATHSGDTALAMITRKYQDSGYTLPQIIFWNLNHYAGTLPVKIKDTGTALISGFSPSILTSLLGGKVMTAESIMLDTVMKDRYSLS